MTIYEMVQLIPDFVDSEGDGRVAGTFHLGVEYDVTMWRSMDNCSAFPCEEQDEDNE